MTTRAPDPRTARTRAAILGATAELLGTPGGTSASVAQIAKRAGVSVGSVYIHFENKDELVSQVILQAWERRQESFVQARQAGGPLERVLAFGEALIDVARHEPVTFRALRLRAVDPPQDPGSATERALLVPHLALLEADLAEAMEQGQIVDGPVEVLAGVLLSLWGGIAERLVRRDGLELSGESEVAVRELGRRVLEAGLAPATVAS